VILSRDQLCGADHQAIIRLWQLSGGGGVASPEACPCCGCGGPETPAVSDMIWH
jgi:hypothetical protein